MPDTYTSQFSGEEIDAALRAAQIISGASTPAELRKKLEIRGDTIPVSAEDSTPISDAVKYRTNPNLLDNWFFARPVNQRNGYYIPAGVKYNTLSWTEAGTTDKAYPVIGYSGQDPLITVNGTNYIVGKSAQVPGYCAAGYTVDRWRTGYDGTFTVNVSDAGVSLVSGNDGSWKNFSETIETSKLIVGRTYTFSFLAEDNGGVRQVYISDYGSVFDGDKGLYTITFVAKETTRNQDFGIQTNVGKTSIPLAAKLELGDTQTLAHKENEKWVLNEIPDFGEQLRRCQWYCRVYKAGTTLPCLAYPQMDGGWYASAGLPTNGMRTIPTNNLGDGKKVAITDLDGADATHDDMSISNWGQNENMLCLHISGGSHGVLTSKFPYWIKLKEDLILSADL